MAKAKKQKKAKKSGDKNMHILAIGALLMGIVFYTTTFILVIALLPSFVALIVDSSKKKMKFMTVAFMNAAGTMPFLLDLWRGGGDFDTAFGIITDPKAVVVIYAAAGIGYLIDWAVVGLVSKLMLEKGKARKKAIEKRQNELVERWGEGVTGDLRLDERGFRVDSMTGD